MKKLLTLTLFTILIAFPVSILAKGPSLDRGPLSKIRFIHYRRGSKPIDLPTPQSNNVKPPWVAEKEKPSKSSCYAFIANGARWRETEPVVLNPTNLDGLSDSFLTDATERALDTWDTETSFNIFGSLSLDNSASFVSDTIDYQNVIGFDYYGDSNVIGVTTVWGYFYGNPKTRELIEWDMTLNESFDWGDATATTSSVMDYENILTHELGHSAGMGDLYESSCVDETMYGYSGYGETSKRDLNAGDIAGILKLYK